MKLSLLVVSCLLFAAVHSAAVDLDSAYLTDAELSLMKRAAAQAPTKEDVKAILKQAEIDLQAAIKDVDESNPQPVVSTGAKRSAPPGQWTLEVTPVAVNRKRSPSPGEAGVDYNFKTNKLTGFVSNDHWKGSGYYNHKNKEYGGSVTYKNGAHSVSFSGSRGQGGSNYGATYKYSWKRSAKPAMPVP